MTIKTFYIDPLQSGISGNMLLGALIDAGGDEKEFREIAAQMGRETGCKIEVGKCGISSLFVDIWTDARCKE
ncbi:MAG: nickel insertion protein [Candidatus Hydrothermarchaeaceae archaeon]